ncbi:MAG TPA: hypothetical protein VEL74_15145 [Thermoanaerobaculia bacterium]|nr:hypothetical protein [Thermoanaerobaculia bacterium]
MRSKSLTLGLLVLVACSGASWAAGAVEGLRTPAELTFGNRPAAQAPTAPLTRTLFVRVPGKAGRAERSLEVRVQFNGRPYLTEKIVVPASRQDLAIELLARDPKALEGILGLADREVGAITVALHLDGKALHEMTLQELERASVRLRGEDGFRPVPAASKVELLIPAPPAPDFLKPAMDKGYQPDPECEQQCHDTYVTCYYEICDQRGDCSYCWEDYEYCDDMCPQICVDPKSVQTFTTTQVIGVTTYWSTCYERPWENDFTWGRWYDYRRYDYKHTQIRRTTNCDNSYTDEVLSVSYSSDYCNYETFSSCYQPSSKVSSWDVCF